MAEPDHGRAARGRRRGTAAGRALAALAAVLVLAAGCRTAGPPRLPTGPRRPVDHGLASWYGPGFEGRRTASGEVLDGDQLTAAHRTLPFGTVVEVLNLDNGRSVRVRINDRGPFVRRRVIDLSRAAAQELGLIGPGVAPVEIYLVGEGVVTAAFEPTGGPFTIQVGAFLELDRARALQAELAGDYPAVGVASDGTWNRVQVGRFSSREQAEKLRRELARQGYPALVVRLPDGAG
jgi:peptidoglycan lytic transglycosylase